MDIRNMVDEVPYNVDPMTVEIDESLLADMDADACIGKISNWERYRKFWLDYYAKKVDEVNQRCDRNIAYQRRRLQDFFLTVPHRSTKTMEAYDLPSGRIAMTFATRKMVPDKASLLERLKEDGEMEYIKTTVKEDVAWSSYKNRLVIDDNGNVVDKKTGEIIEDVHVEVTESEFTVNANTQEDDGE